MKKSNNVEFIMDILLQKLNEFCKNILTYKKINKITKKTYMRNSIRNGKGLSIIDAIMFKFLYVLKNTTKDDIVSDLQKTTNILEQTSYTDKENNIPVEIYKLLSDEILRLTNNYINKLKTKKIHIIAFDGSNNNDQQMNVCLNMGCFDVTSNVPVLLISYGSLNRNKEIEKAIEIIKNKKDDFKKSILVFDRFYFSYNFMKFLIDNKMKFIIRARKDAKYLDNELNIINNSKNKNLIELIKPITRVIKFNETYTKTVYSKKTKKNESKKYTFEIQNDCVLITNISKSYNNATIMDFYRSRWDIETYFKLVKNNFKFQHVKDKTNDQIQKTNYCILIYTTLCKLIETHKLETTTISKIKYKRNGTNIKCNLSINESLLISIISKNVIKNMLEGNLTYEMISNIEKQLHVLKNEPNRSFPRNSKIPFTKWNIKGYSINSQIIKILRVLNKEIHNGLNKNLKLLVGKIKILNIEPNK